MFPLMFVILTLCYDPDNTANDNRNSKQLVEREYLTQKEPGNECPENGDESHKKHAYPGTQQYKCSEQKHIAEGKTDDPGKTEPKPLLLAGCDGKETAKGDEMSGHEQNKRDDQPQAVHRIVAETS